MKKGIIHIITIFFVSYCFVTLFCGILCGCFPDLQCLVFCIWYTVTLVFWGVTAVTVVILYAKLVKIRRQLEREDDKL